MTLTGITTPNQSEPESHGNKKCTPHLPNYKSEASLSDAV